MHGGGLPLTVILGNSAGIKVETAHLLPAGPGTTREAGTRPQGVTQLLCARSYLEKVFSETRGRNLSLVLDSSTVRRVRPSPASEANSLIFCTGVGAAPTKAFSSLFKTPLLQKVRVPRLFRATFRSIAHRGGYHGTAVGQMRCKA